MIKERRKKPRSSLLGLHVGFSHLSHDRPWKQHVFMLLFSTLIGILGAYASIGFRYLINLIQNLLMLQRGFSFEEHNPVYHPWGYWVVFIPVIGLSLSYLLIRYLAVEARGHGVPEIMEANLFRGGKIRKRLVFIKALASALTIGSGGSVGREGPIAQMGAAMGSTIGQIFKVDKDTLRILLACGTTAGIAATFNTPIAAVIFSIELIVFEFKLRSFIPLVVSSVFATTISRAFWGNVISFPVPQYTMVDARELLFYLVLGLLSGLYAVLFTNLIYYVEDLVAKMFRKVMFLAPICGGLAIGIIGIFYPQIFGVGYHTVTEILNGNVVIEVLAALLVVKLLAVVITLSAGGSGGIFSPSLFMGAALGGAFGYVVNAFFPHITASPGAYALVGMAALFSAASRATLTSIIILFEMTLDYNIIIPLMFACVISDALSATMMKDSIYTRKIRRKGLALDMDMEIDLMYTHRVEEIMTTISTILPGSMSLKEALQESGSSNFHRFPVVDENESFIGVITYRDIKAALNEMGDEAKLQDVKKLKKEYVVEGAFIKAACNKLSENNLKMVPVVEPKTLKVKGVIARSDFFKLNNLK